MPMRFDLVVAGAAGYVVLHGFQVVVVPRDSPLAAGVVVGLGEYARQAGSQRGIAVDMEAGAARWD